MVINKVSDKRADVKIDFDKKLKYGVFVELGANGREPKPFLRNAVDNNQDSINKAILNQYQRAWEKGCEIGWIYLRAYTSTCLPTAR